MPLSAHYRDPKADVLHQTQTTLKTMIGSLPENLLATAVKGKKLHQLPQVSLQKAVSTKIVLYLGYFHKQTDLGTQTTHIAFQAVADMRDFILNNN